MKSPNFHTILFVSLFSVGAIFAQDTRPGSSGSKPSVSESRSAKRGPVFRASKDQINAAQAMLRTKGAYNGDSTGKLDSATRAAIKGFQKENGLSQTGTLNRATLEKMGIALTAKQKEIPVSDRSYAKAGSKGDKPARSIFRATKEQIVEAQKLLKTGGIYTGEETGKLDDTTRESLKKYQEANGLKATGTLNQVTLEKLGVALTDKQKEGPR